MTNFDLSKPYNKYAQDVVDHKILAGKWIILACQRYIDWFDRDDVFFDYDDVDRKLRFVQKLKHFKGKFNKQNFILFDWQQWIYAGIYGFKYVSTNLRVVKNVLMLISRKNGKSSLAATMGIVAAFADNEPGAEIACIANSSAQANILFEMIRNYTASVDPQQLIFKRFRGSINIPVTNSKIIIHSSDPAALDGYNCSTFICDEYAAAKDSKVYDLMKNSQGMRTQPLAIVITTTGFLVGEEYPLYSMWKTYTEILQGLKHDDSIFAAMYQMDEDDDWKDKSLWKKCSPGYPDIVNPQFMDEGLLGAINNPSTEVEFKTKLLNQWCTSEVTWIPREAIMEHTQPFNLEDFKQDELYCYVGIDLSSVSDFTAITYMFALKNKYYFKTDLYLPDGSIDKSSNKDLYRKWIKDGYLKTTHGARINYQEIVSDIMNNNTIIPILEIAYDPYNSAEAVRLLNDSGMVMTPFKQTKGNFNLATKEFERRFFNNEIILDDNPAVRWCFANAMLEYDNLENCKPVKGAGKNNKIDAVISILESFGTYILREEQIGTISHI